MTAVDAAEPAEIRPDDTAECACPGTKAGSAVDSCYRLLLPAAEDQGTRGAATMHTEFSGRTVNRGMEISYQERLSNDDVEAARKALAAIRERRQPLQGTLLRKDRLGQWEVGHLH